MVDEETRQMKARELAAGTSSSRVEVVEKSTTEVQILLWALLRVSLLRVQVLGNWTCLLIDLRRYAPYVCFTYHPIFIF